MRRVGLWALAVLLVVGALALWAWLHARGDRRGANRAMADAIDSWHKPKILTAKARADQLAGQVAADSEIVKEARAEVTALRAELEQKYQKLELSPEEIEARFKDLRV